MTTITTKQGISFFHLAQLKGALSLECKGLKHSRGSVYQYVKNQFGFKGNKQKVYDQLVKYIEQVKVIHAQVELANPVTGQPKI